MNNEIATSVINLVQGTKYIYKDGIEAVAKRMKIEYPE